VSLRGLLSACVVLLAASSYARTVPAVGPEPIDQSLVMEAIRDAVHDAAVGGGPRITPNEQRQLATVYEAGQFAPLWVDDIGRPNSDAREALALLTGAAAEGLEPADYGARSLQELSAALAAARPQEADVARFDIALTAGAIRYFADLHHGRVDPRSIGFRTTAPADRDDFGLVLRSAVAAHDVPQAAGSLAPPLALYRGLRAMLARYRLLAARPLSQLRPSTRPIKPDEPYADVRSLSDFLLATGDLASAGSAAVESGRYGGALVDAVKQFQMRHGLEADGVLGVRTQAALAVPLSTRVRQIELAMERLRWLPHLSAERFLAVNIPMFHLWVWDKVPPNGAPSFGMHVIVGRALNRQTPVFVEQMDSIIFRPFWNVPSSIVRGEILPALNREPDYRQRQDMESVAGQGDNARPVAATADSLLQLKRGRLRLRQRPGPKNALGLVKFVFPNDENVYLHGTPAPQLFRQSRRDFSHGCVRVEDPVGLAEWALKGQDGWTHDEILAAMNGEQSRRVTLTRPVQVILFYITAIVMPEDGTVRFAEDIYGHDARLERALGRPR